MPISKDCVNTQSFLGRNLTPYPIIEAARAVAKGKIDVDFASDSVANADIMAEKYFDVIQDGYSQIGSGFYDFVWGNFPGHSFTGGTIKERRYWLDQLNLPKEKRAPQPESIYQIKSAHWHHKIWKAYQQKRIKHFIGLVYRGGSIGSVKKETLQQATICLTCSGVSSPVVNKSGRISFETVYQGIRESQTDNTQSSMIYLLTREESRKRLFIENFSKFGVCFQPLVF